MSTHLAATGLRVLWKRNTGRIHSRNNIITRRGNLILGTCGRRWNHGDNEDGVSQLNCQTGDLVWFTPTGSDVNEIAEAGEHLLCPTDHGEIFILAAASGEIVRIHRLDASALSKPLVWESETGWEAVAISAVGTVYRFDAVGNSTTILGALKEPVRANLVNVGSRSERVFIVATESGLLVKCQFAEGSFAASAFSRVVYHGSAFSAAGGGIEQGVERTGTIHAAPVLDGNQLFVGFARNSYSPEPPLICVDAVTGETIWRSPQSPQQRFGNCRVTPIVVGRYLVAAFAYSNSLHIFDKETGVLVATVAIGPHVFQQWSAPVLYGSNHVVIGRIDGVVSIVGLKEEALIASVSLADHDVRFGPVDDVRRRQTYALYPRRRPLGICGTPTVSDEVMFVGTTSGELVAIELGV
jgi:outer membrane protein assembly factor BamB